MNTCKHCKKEYNIILPIGYCTGCLGFLQAVDCKISLTPEKEEERWRDVCKKLNLREETVSGFGEIAYLKNYIVDVIAQSLQSERDRIREGVVEIETHKVSPHGVKLKVLEFLDNPTQ